MQRVQDEEIRALFNAEGTYIGPLRTFERSLLCFAQAAPDGLAFASVEGFLLRFLSAKVGPYVPKHAPSTVDLAVIASRDGVSGMRFCSARAATTDDVTRAERAEAEGGLPGLAALAKRCPSVFEVEALGDDDPLALTLACGIAMHYAGPVIPPNSGSIVGVKSLMKRLGI
jgi:hypothetical protein